MEIQIISGFLGAGKTTFLNKYLPLLSGKTAVIENEFGEVGLDGALIQGDIPVKELSSGCICCSLAIDLKDGIEEIAKRFEPDRIVIEPSGVGKLSDVMSACEKAKEKLDIEITKRIVIVDACDCALYTEEFGQFYSNQIEYANIVLLSNIQEATEDEMNDSIACIKKLNPYTVIYDEDWRELEGEELLSILNSEAISEGANREDVATAMGEEDVMLTPVNQVFSSVALEDSCRMAEEDIQTLLGKFNDRRFGHVLRAKGIVPAAGGGAWHFDYTNSVKNYEKTEQMQEDMNRVIIIGSGLNKKEIRKFVYSLGEDDDED